jgi:chemotaxis protein MotB
MPHDRPRRAALAALAGRCALTALGVLAALDFAGCQNGAFRPPAGATVPGVSVPGVTSSAPANGAFQQQAQSLATQVQDLNRRVAQLDLNNADLHRQLAQAEQLRQTSQEQVTLLQKQLGEVAQKYRDSQLAQQEAQKQVTALHASTRFRGGAAITANNSVKQSLASINIPSLEIRQDGEVIRIDIPADRLFVPGSAQLQADGLRTLDEVSAAITRSYPRQRIVIEAHTDDASAANPTAAHSLTATQSQAVFIQLVQRGRLPPRQLSVLAMGDNHPLASNGTPAGKAKNRRVEIVVYPDTF